MLERDIEKKLAIEIKRKGEGYKFVSPQMQVPDRIVVLPNGKLVFVELKTEKGKLTASRMPVRRLADLGQHVEVLYGIEAVKDFISLQGWSDNEITQLSKYCIQKCLI